MNDKEKGKIIQDFLTWLLDDQNARICHSNLYPVTTWKTHGPIFFTEKYLRRQNIKTSLRRKV